MTEEKFNGRPILVPQTWSNNGQAYGVNYFPGQIFYEADEHIYVAGSMRNPKVPELANRLRGLGYTVFDDWYSAGPEADDYWQKYEKERGRSMAQALKGAHAQEVFHFDKRNLDKSSAMVLVLPAGKSGHIELGYMIGRGKKAYILLDGEPERYDVMYNFATAVLTSEDELVKELKRIGV